MHYLFRGLRRGVGESVTGRVTAPSEDAVREVLDTHGIIVETLGPEESGGLFPPIVEEALEDAGLRVTFNQLARVHEGRNVWVLDRDKISGRVMRLVREALGEGEAHQHSRHRIGQALETAFGNRRPAVAPHAGGDRHAEAGELRAEVNRLMAAMSKLERTMATMATRSWRSDREPRRAVVSRTPRDRTRDEVLLEIFRHNLELMELTRPQEALAAAG